MNLNGLGFIFVLSLLYFDQDKMKECYNFIAMNDCGTKKTEARSFFNEEEFQMEKDGREERGKMTAEKTRKMLKDGGVEVTLEQAGMILEFLRKLANMAVSNYLKKKDEKNSRPIRESEYR